MQNELIRAKQENVDLKRRLTAEDQHLLEEMTHLRVRNADLDEERVRLNSLVA